jgi:hypothetical protein
MRKMIVTGLVIVSHHRNPSALCNAAWSKFGANGDYKRQMLEAK